MEFVNKSNFTTTQVLIVVLCYNEEEYIAVIIDKLMGQNLDFIISDGGSTDKTLDIIAQKKASYFIRPNDNNGYGSGINQAIEIAQKKGYEYIGIVDCDLSYPIEYFPVLLQYIPEYELIIAVRNFKDLYSGYRKLGNIFFRTITNLLFCGSYTDVLSGMRVFKVNMFQDRIKDQHFGWIPQMNGIALKNKIKIKEVPIPYTNLRTNSKLRYRDAIIVFWAILVERFR